MAGYWPHSFLRFYGPRLDVKKNAKKELGQYPAILTSCLVNNAYIITPCEVIIILNYAVIFKMAVLLNVPFSGFCIYYSFTFM